MRPAGTRRRRKTEAAIAGLDAYRRKRRFDRTAEPAGGGVDASPSRLFVVQKHAARRLHYDLRLQFSEVLKSWAVTRAPSADPRVRRLAVHVEDHPLAYAEFEGAIPAGEYGAGQVIVWDRGEWTPTSDPEDGYARGILKFRLSGTRMQGGWSLVRLKEQGRRDNWLLIKERDSFAHSEAASAEAPEPAGDDDDERSILSGRSLADLRETPAEAAAASPGAIAAAMADFVAPQLAVPCDEPPAGDDWLHEIKYDGYRTLARLEEGRVRFLTRNGLDWTARYAPLAASFRDLSCRRALIDGEIVVQDSRGVSDFARLQDVLATGAGDELLFYAFDLLHLDDHDLRPVPLLRRKQVLAGLLAGAGRNGALLASEHIFGAGSQLLAEGCRMAIEGIVSKHCGAPYRSGRRPTWRKCKCVAADEFVIVGYTRSDAAGGLAALLLAEQRDDSSLAYVGKTGTGFSRTVAVDLERRLEAIRTTTPVVAVPPAISRTRPIWVEPRLIAQVHFATRTSEGRLRQAVFKGLRGDKALTLTLTETLTAADLAGGKSPIGPARRWVSDADLASVWVTNPQRPMFGGPSKLDLALYYARVGDWLLTEVAGRPLSLVRCPTGKAEDCFYQRNVTPGMPQAVGRSPLPPVGDEPGETLIHIDNAAGLLALAQFGTIELHCRGCRVAAPDRPDRLVFDLDPDEGLGWEAVVEAAFLLRERLDAIGLVPFVRTTGGKGAHVVVAILPRFSWSQVLAFTGGFAAALAKAAPDRFTVTMSKRARRGRIFIDYLRNARTATAVCAYSLRARRGVSVATPVGWDELGRLSDPRCFDWQSVPERLDRLVEDPWRDLDAASRVISAEARQFAGVTETWKDA